MNTLVKRTRSRSPFRRRRRVDELIHDIEKKNFQLLEQNQSPPRRNQSQTPPPASPIHRKPSQEQDGSTKNTSENPTESAVIEVVLDATPSQKKKNFVWSRSANIKKRWPSTVLPAPPLCTSSSSSCDIPELGTLSSTSSGGRNDSHQLNQDDDDDNNHKGNVIQRNLTANRARKSFKEKYMAPKENSVNSALGEGTRRCFSFVNSSGPTQPEVGGVQSTSIDGGLDYSPTIPRQFAPFPTSPGSDWKPSESLTSRGRSQLGSITLEQSQSRGLSASRSRSQSRGRSQSRSRSQSRVSVSRLGNMPSSDPVRVLSPYRRRSDAFRTASKTWATPESNSIQEGTNNDYFSGNHNKNSQYISPLRSPRRTASLNARRSYSSRRLVHQSFSSTNQTTPKRRTTPQSHNRGVDCRTDEVEQEQEEFPSELLIPCFPKSSTNTGRGRAGGKTQVELEPEMPSRPLEMMRSKSLYSEISSRSSFHDSSSVADSEPESVLKRILHSIECNMEEATQKGRRIDRRLVYQSLLNVSNSVPGVQEREAMQREISSLMKAISVNADGGQLTGENDWTYDDSAVCRDDTMNFLQEFFGFVGLWNKQGNGTAAIANGAFEKEQSSRRRRGYDDDDDEDWGSFMEATGLKHPKMRNGHPTLPSYSEHMGESAFVSRLPKGSGSMTAANKYSSAGEGRQTTRYSFPGKEDRRHHNDSNTDSARSWWRQRDKYVDTFGASANGGVSANNNTELEQHTSPTRQSVSKKKFRDSARQKRATTVSPPRMRLFGRNSSNHNAPTGNNSGIENRQYTDDEEDHHVDRNNANFYYDNDQGEAPRERRRTVSSIKSPQRSRSCDGRRT